MSFAVVLSSCATSSAASPEGSATAAATAAPAPAPAPEAAAKPAGKSLYERLGGMDAIKAVINDFIETQAADPKLAHFYTKTDKKYLKGQLVDMVCQATGGPCKYTGMDMKDAHEGRHVKDADFGTTVGNLVSVLNKYKVPEQEQKELLAILAPMKPDIVEK